MKKTIFATLAVILLMSSVNFSSAKQRIGVFDSRMIAIWNFNSPEFREKMGKMMQEYKTAKEKKDSAKIKELEERGPLTQRILHDKGFGRGSVAEIIEKKQDELKAVAKSEKLLLIVSKWEVPYSSDDVELVDITVKLLEALKADANTIKMYDEAKNQKPIEDAFFLDPRE